MNTDERILQILENSACLSKGQLLGYVKKTLYPEELRAVELHLSSCAFCNDAVEGIALQADPDRLLAALAPPPLPAMPAREKKEKKEPAALKEEKTISLHKPAARQDAVPDETRTTNNPMMPRRRLAKPLGIAATLLLGAGALWYFMFNRPGGMNEGQLAQVLPAQQADSVTVTDERGTAIAAEKPAMVSDQQAIAQKRKDSLLLAKQAAAPKATRSDTAASQPASAKFAADATRAIAAQRKEADTTRVAAIEQDTKNAIAAAPAAARSKEERKADESDNTAKKKPALSDYELGMQQYRQKNYASALLYFKTAESDKSDPKHWDAVYYSALCNKNLNKERKARKLFERVVEAGAPQKKSAQKQLDDMEKKQDK